MKIRHLDPSILPGETEAGKPEFLPTEGQAQQQRVDQQGKQQRKTESSVLGARATNRLPAEAGSIHSGRRQRIGWLFGCGVGRFGIQAHTAIAARVQRWTLGNVASWPLSRPIRQACRSVSCQNT